MSADETKNAGKVDEEAINVKYVDSIQLPKEKGSKGPLVATVILSLLLVAATGYIVYDAIMDAKRNAEVSDNEEVTEEEKTLVDEVKDAVAGGSFEFEYLGDGRETSDYQLGTSYYGVSVAQGETRRNFTTSLNYGNNQYGLSGSGNYESKPSDNLEFGSDVRAVVAGGVGQGIGGEVILFLLQDGSVEYLPVRRCMSAGKVWTEKVSGVKDIVSISGASVSEDEGGGYATIILEQSSGGFYDLSDYVNTV